MKKLPISIGILSWHSGQTLIDTLFSYHQNGLFKIVNDITILFQEITDEDKQIADHFSLSYIGLNENIGIGKAFIKLTENAQTENILLLEHDWKLIENLGTTYNRLNSGLDLLNNKYDCIRYRHKSNPGYPHFSFRHKGNELNYYDDELECTSPHLLDSLHWLDPSESFPDKIQKKNEYFITTSRWGNWTNNPCLYKKEFYLDIVSKFAGEGIALEGNISKWWAQQTFKVAHGEGLFTHFDPIKYPYILNK
jgi:hypothetical protein